MELSANVRRKLETVKKHNWGLLELRNCGLTEIPKEVFDCEDLVNLDLGNDDFCDDSLKNKIKVIPNDIANLKKLSKLDLSNNQLTELNEKVADLKNLEILNLKGNELIDFSPRIANLQKLKQLKLEGNPFEMIPPEIVARGIESLRNFFIELEEKDFLYESKLIIVGEGRVGKTCLTKAITNPNFKLGDEESTEGININRWVIPKDEIKNFNPRIQRDLQVNIWDFGGQEIYHSTHQFFLTKRSAYLLVTESRKEDRHDDFFYWLNIIKLLGDKSPIILVLNKSDQPTKELPLKEFRESFGSIVDYKKISLKVGYEDTLNDFKNTLKQITANLPHIGNALPKKWVNIRIEIEELKLAGKNFITETEYLEICKKHYRKTESALFLSDYFHDLGVLLHFQSDIDLKDTIFLNHEWITKGIYKILDDKIVIQNKGKFGFQDILRIWNEEEYRNKSRELLSLMKNRKFDLCFELGNGEYIVPRLLPVDEIEHNWMSASGNLKFEIHYKFMPKGILTRLIVKLNQDILDNQYWRYGVILKYQDTKAIVKEKYFESKITVELSGTSKREYLFMIRKAVNEIHKDYNRIQYDEKVPCNCSLCLQGIEPHFYSFELLRRYEIKGKQKITCEISLDDVPVHSLTSDVIRGKLSDDKMIVCENLNAGLLNSLNLNDIAFCPEKDSASVFMQVRTKTQIFGLRDRDFLLDCEIEKLQAKFPNYYILEYYCIENYLFHPENVAELKLDGFNKEKYQKEIIDQKNKKKNEIILNYTKNRDTYQEFKLPQENFRQKEQEKLIFEYLESDNVEVFFKAFSLKTHFSKASIASYNLRQVELAKTFWFKERMKAIFYK